MLRLKRVLEVKGLSTKVCAIAVGCSEQSMYSKITGMTDFTYREACRLRAFLPEYNIDFLLTDESHLTVTKTVVPPTN